MRVFVPAAALLLTAAGPLSAQAFPVTRIATPGS